jgi:hypothetical protein
MRKKNNAVHFEKQNAHSCRRFISQNALPARADAQISIPPNTLQKYCQRILWIVETLRLLCKIPIGYVTQPQHLCQTYCFARDA